MMMSAALSQLMVIDIQERLLPAVAEVDSVRDNAIRLLKAANRLKCPVLVSEQYPKGIGHTDPRVALELGPNCTIFEKLEFSAARDVAFLTEVTKNRIAQRTQIIICGIEAHVCVLQTALDLKARGFEVFCVEDAMSSRSLRSKDVAIARMRQCGIEIVTAEMVLFEWLGRAGTADFKALLPLIK